MTERTARLAVPTHLGRVAPLFDVAERIELYDVSGGTVKPAGDLLLTGGGAQERLARLRDEGVDTVICGAISGVACNALMANGLRVVPWVCGPVDSVLGAYRTGTLGAPGWRMPGRGGRAFRRGRRGRGGRGRRFGPGFGVMV
jgi:predicted Fe-Mo cluster-binding NifX family protein